MLYVRVVKRISISMRWDGNSFFLLELFLSLRGRLGIEILEKDCEIWEKVVVVVGVMPPGIGRWRW